MQTRNPVALQQLMTETVFAIPDTVSASVEPIRLTEQTTPSTADQTLTFKYWGENQKKYLFVTHDEQHEYLSPLSTEAFHKILTALELDQSHVAITNISGATNIDKQQLLLFFKPKVVILFDVGPKISGMQLQKENVTWEEQGVSYYQAFTFEQILEDTEKKRAFWNIIKTLLT